MNRQLITPKPNQFEHRQHDRSRWLLRMGFHLGRGHSSVKVAELLADGTGPETIRHMFQTAELPSPGRRRVIVPLNLESWERDILQRHADERRITVHDLIYRMVASGLVLDDLFDAVTDGRYD